jgi:hypothetical protein
MDCLSYARHYRCTQRLASVCMHTSVCFPPPLVGTELGCECVGQPQFFCRHLVADLKLMGTEGHDKSRCGNNLRKS